MDKNPHTFVSSLVLASWLRDADEPLDTFRSLSTCSLQWGMTRPKVLWMFAPQKAAQGLPRPSVAEAHSYRLNVWSLLDPPIRNKKQIMGWIQQA